MPNIRVLIADGHAVAGDAFEALLRDQFDLVGVMHDIAALLDAMEKLRPDVIVVDVSAPSWNGLGAIRKIRDRYPDARVVALASHPGAQLAADALRAGACACLPKASAGEDLVTAIRQADQGCAYMPASLTRDLMAHWPGKNSPQAPHSEPLTPRQREVLHLLAEGRSAKEVAAILHISPRTAESHKYDIMQNLGVKTTMELIRYAHRAKTATG